MFATRYFCNRGFAPRYFCKIGGAFALYAWFLALGDELAADLRTLDEAVFDLDATEGIEMNLQLGDGQP